MTFPVPCRAALMLVCLFELSLGQPGVDRADELAPEAAFDTADVMLDGEILFSVRGVSAYPAASRARVISERIRAFARTDVPASDLKISEGGNFSRIAAGDAVICAFTEADATAEGAPRALLAQMAAERIATAVRAYREARSPVAVTKSAAYATAATAAVVLAILTLVRLFRKLGKSIDRFCRVQIEKAPYQALRMVEVERIAGSVQSTLRLLRTVTLFFVCLAYLDMVLALFPWTRPASQRVFRLVLDPLEGWLLDLLTFSRASHF